MTTTTLDLTSPPCSPWSLNDKARTNLRCHLVAAADALRMEGRLCKAEKLYREAARFTDTGPGAVEHILRMAQHCRDLYESRKASKAATKKVGRSLSRAR